MFDNEVLRRRIAALLIDTEQLTLPEQIIHMSPADRADALTGSWNLRHRWKRLIDDLDRKTGFDYDGKLWKDVALAADSLFEGIRRFDYIQIELLALSQHSIADRAAALRSAEESRIARMNPRSDV